MSAREQESTFLQGAGKHPSGCACGEESGEFLSSQSESNPQLWPMKLTKLCSFCIEDNFSSCLKTLSQSLMGLALKGVRGTHDSKGMELTSDRQ